MNDVQEKMEYLVKVNGCKITILDPMTLACLGRGLDGTDQFHVMVGVIREAGAGSPHQRGSCRKAQGGQKAGSAGGTIHEEDAKGSVLSSRTA
jgi:hypothetical protein